MNIKSLIEKEISSWAQVGHHAMLQRFILEQGREFVAGPRSVKKMKMKECFRNATQVALSSSEFTYVEGYVLSEDIPILIHHAWLTKDGETAMDPTLDAEGHFYYGVMIPLEELVSEISKSRVYGIFDTGLGLNASYLFDRMPSLKDIVKSKRPISAEEIGE